MVLGLCSCPAGGKLAAEALREIKDGGVKEDCVETIGSVTP